MNVMSDTVEKTSNSHTHTHTHRKMVIMVDLSPERRGADCHVGDSDGPAFLAASYKNKSLMKG